VLSSLCWGLITTFSRLAYDHGSTPQTLVLIRFGFGAGLIALVALLQRRPLRLPPHALLSSLWLALAFLGMSFGYLSSVRYIPVSLAAMVFYTYPLLVGVLASLLGREPMTWAKGLSLCLAFAGLVLALGPSFAELDPRGIALAAVAALSVTAITTFGGPALRRVDKMAMNVHVNLWSLLAFGAYVAFDNELAAPVTAIGYAGLTGATLCYLVATLAIFAALTLIGPTRIAFLSNIEPVVSLAAATLILGERLGPAQIGGIGLLLTALVAMTLAGGRQAPTPVA